MTPPFSHEEPAEKDGAVTKRSYTNAFQARNAQADSNGIIEDPVLCPSVASDNSARS